MTLLVFALSLFLSLQHSSHFHFSLFPLRLLSPQNQLLFFHKSACKLFSSNAPQPPVTRTLTPSHITKRRHPTLLAALGLHLHIAPLNAQQQYFHRPRCPFNCHLHSFIASVHHIHQGGHLRRKKGPDSHAGYGARTGISIRLLWNPGRRSREPLCKEPKLVNPRITRHWRRLSLPGFGIHVGPHDSTVPLVVSSERKK